MFWICLGCLLAAAYAAGVVANVLGAMVSRQFEAAHNQDGQGMVEYALILVLIAVVVIVTLILVGNQVQNLFCNISAGLGT